MNETLYSDCLKIVKDSIKDVLPNKGVKNALINFNAPKGNIYMIAIGKAAFQMAKETLKHINIKKGIVITKYKHSKGKLKNTKIFEAGHPIIDENSIKATKEAIKLVSSLTKDDIVIFLVSGGGSALFEEPLIPLNELQDISDQLIKSGATIQEINTVRKRLSKVKGGKFAKLCHPAKVFNIILSDIIDSPLDMIASGPTVIDNSTYLDAIKVIKKYKINISNKTIKLLKNKNITKLNNVETHICLDNQSLKQAANKACLKLGYKTRIVEKPLTSNINQAEKYLKKYIDSIKPHSAIIVGGEIVLKVKGKGLGGRNQEFALRLGKHLKNNDTSILCIGSDGTDGPTNVAGAYVYKSIIKKDIDNYLKNNDSYNYLKKYGGHIKTGPTGTNVCDLYMIIRK